MAKKDKANKSRQDRSGLARIVGAKGGKQHTEQDKPHTSQRRIERSGKVTRTRSTKKDNQ